MKMNFQKLFRLHLDYGLNKIDRELESVNITSGNHISYLMKLVKNGLDLQANTIKLHINSTNRISVKDYTNPLTFILGELENW